MTNTEQIETTTTHLQRMTDEELRGLIEYDGRYDYTAKEIERTARAKTRAAAELDKRTSA
jgi:hypothetical protein